MSRAGYSDDLDPLVLGRWRGRVASAMRGKRGQAFLRELLADLDTLPQKRLVANEFANEGEVCALGSVGRVRGIDMSKLIGEFGEVDDDIGDVFGIAEPMAKEIMWWNDEGGWNETPEERFVRMHKWVTDQIIEPSAT